MRLSIRPSVPLSVWSFHGEPFISFFLIFFMMVDNNEIKNRHSPIFQENYFFPKKGQNEPKITRIIFFLRFSKIFSLLFSEFGIKGEFILLALS